MGVKETGCSRVRIWVGLSYLVGVCETVEVKTGFYSQVLRGLGVGLDESVVSGPKG